MKPILRDGDLLEVSPSDERPPRVGDVILFQPPTGNRAVAHRVIRLTGNSIRTRGDNSTAVDPWLLRREDVAGVAVATWRARKRRRIARGRLGSVSAHVARWYNFVDRAISRLLHRPYYLLARHGTFRHVVPVSLRPRPILFRTRGQSWVRLLMGRRVVGWYDRHSHRWYIQRPYRLFVDERGLPREGEGALPSPRHDRVEL